MFHQASMLFSALVMLMGAGWYGLHSHGDELRVRETVETASEAAELSVSVSDRTGSVPDFAIQ